MSSRPDKSGRGDRSSRRRRLAVAAVVSVAVHLAVVLLVELPSPDPPDSDDPEEKQLNVNYVPIAEEPESPDPERPEERKKATAKAPTEEPEPTEQTDEKERREEPKKQKKKKKKKRQDLNRKAVVQKTNEEQPEQADFVSEKANRVEEETRARETVQKFVEPSEKTGPDDQKKTEEKAADKKPAPKTGARASRRPRRPTPESKKQPDPSPDEPESTARPERDSGEEEREKDEEAPGPEPGDDAPESEPSKDSEGKETETPSKPLPTPSVGDYDKVFAGEDDEAIERHRNSGVGSEMFERIEESKGDVGAALQNYIPEVKPGNHTAVNAKSDVAATYVNKIHSKIHPRWGGDYLMELESSYGPNHPLSDPSLNAELELVVDGETGELETVNIVRSSGYAIYDMEAIEIVRSVAPNPEAPDEIVSPDGNVYLHWNFWRNQRQCGTFGVSVFKKTGEGEKEVQTPETK